MKTEACERYLAEPEANASHLAECEECAALFSAGDVAGERSRFNADMLPLAPWEGAGHRSWPLVIAGAMMVLIAAAALFAVAGVAPLSGFIHAIRSTFPSFTTMRLLLRYVGEGVQHAPAAVQIGVAISFLVVNMLLIVLLRRAPKGIDV